MSEHVEGLNRNQTALFPDTLEGYVEKENPVRFIDAFVDSLNLEKLGFKHSIPSDLGRPSYNPSDLLKLYVYGYLNQVRSSRKLERECHRNLEVMWLMRKLTPDFKTIADFRRDNIDCVKGVFKEFVKVCMGLDLYGAKLVAVDGVKFKAANSIDNNYNRKNLTYRLRVIDERVSKYIKEMEEEDRQEENCESKHADLLEEKVKKLLKRKDEYTEILAKLKESNQNEVSLVDPDSRLMKSRGVIEPCYNSHVAVDAKNHLIVDYNVTNSPVDNSQLSSIAKAAKETLGAAKLEAVGDKGFFNFVEIKKCVDDGITPYVPEQNRYGVGFVKRMGIPSRDFHVDKFFYDKGTDTFLCPAGKTLEMSYVDRAHEKNIRVYRTGECFECGFFLKKCTRNKHGRTLWRWEHAEVLDDMRERMLREPEKLAMRKSIVEHPFGIMKRAFNQGYLLLKGLRKVGGEVGFTMLAYNMRRVLNILGPGLMRVF
ncbi:MAG: IS1182 family transposase [Nitrososphaerales archaeon]|jgi:transposase